MTGEPRGIIPAAVTPMTHDHHLDEQGLRNLIEYVISGGVSGIFIVSSTGESYGLSREEKIRAIEITVDQCAGRIAVYAGTGGVTTRDTIDMTQAAESCHVDAVSIVTPYFITPGQQELITHYETIARNTSLPVILYNNSPRTGVTLEVPTVAHLATIKTIVGIKDSSGDMTLAAEYIRVTDQEYFSVLMGRDTLIFGGLCHGATGAIAATANIAPKLCSEIYHRFNQGDLAGAREAQFRLAPLRRAFTLGSFPVVIKEALSLIGLDCGPCMPPVGPLGPEAKNRLTAILKEMQLI